MFRPIGEKAALWFHVTKVRGSPCWLRAIHSYIINMIPNSEASHALHPHGQNVPIQTFTKFTDPGMYPHWHLQANTEKTHLEGFCWPSPSPKFKGPLKPAPVSLKPHCSQRQRTSHVESQCEAAAPAHQKCPEPAMQERIGAGVSAQVGHSKEQDEWKKSWKHHHWRFRVIQFARVVSYYFLPKKLCCAVLAGWKV